MKNPIILLMLSFLLFACPVPDSPSSSEDDTLKAGDSIAYSVGSVDFTLKYCPGGTFNFGCLNDNDYNGNGVADSLYPEEGSPAIINPFWICDIEVTYELWHTIYSWAIANGYSFQNPGIEGHDGTLTLSVGADITLTGDNAEPVSTINWRDSIVFCNALTEWYNTNMGTNFTYVYTKSGLPIKDSSDSNGSNCDSADENYDNSGFRLLKNLEWECAARYINGSSWTSGSFLSGANYDYTNTSECNLVAVWNATGTSAVKSKRMNSLGCYDMSGNIYEFTSTISGVSGSYRWVRGGSWNMNIDYVGILTTGFSNPTLTDDSGACGNNAGLRIGKTP